jgi:hypothetical protein
MTRFRRIVVTSGLVALVGAHLVELTRDSEHWPVCSYPMYAELADEPTVESHRLVGVRADTGAEMWLHAQEYIGPFDQSRLAMVLMRIAVHGGKDRWDRALADLLQRYEQRRQSGLHDGPPLTGMRVYETRHDLHPEAKNRHTPEYRELIAEAEAPAPATEVAE